MPSKDETEIVKNVDFDEQNKKSKKLKKKEEEKEEEEEESVSEENESSENDDTDEDSENDVEEDDDDEDDDEEYEQHDGLTDMGLYNVLGNFLVDEEGNTVGVSLSNIAKELAKLNHILKKYVKNS